MTDMRRFLAQWTYDWSGGNIYGPGTLNIPSGKTLNLSGGLKSQTGGTINNNGTVVVTGAGPYCQMGDAILKELQKLHA